MKKRIYISLLALIVVSLPLLAATKVRVIPIVERVNNNGNGTYTAYFGYYNPNSTTTIENIGGNNRFANPYSSNMGQPSTFLAGRRYSVFSVNFIAGTTEMTWRLHTIGEGSPDYAIARIADAINPDTDTDGVIDNDDDYPLDTARAYDNKTSGCLAFEDLWPDQGDYDMNDMVLDYTFNLVTNAANKIKDISATIKLRAVGASLNNSFAIEFPFPLTAINSYSGTLEGMPYPMLMTASAERCVLIVINGTASLGITTGNGTYWNTQPDQPIYPAKNLAFTITLNTPIPTASLPYLAPFNPFILASSVTGKEIHLPGMPPTANVNPGFFNTGDDTTDPAVGRYYKTSQNLPWAINIPISWTYPIERAQITYGYLAFKNWAESSGSQYPSWYLLDANQVDYDYLYTK